MKITILEESTQEEDGVAEVIAIQREVGNVHDLLDLFSSAAKAFGYTYVDRIGYATEKGAQTWSKF